MQAVQDRPVVVPAAAFLQLRGHWRYPISPTTASGARRAQSFCTWQHPYIANQQQGPLLGSMGFLVPRWRNCVWSTVGANNIHRWNDQWCVTASSGCEQHGSRAPSPIPPPPSANFTTRRSRRILEDSNQSLSATGAIARAPTL